MLSPWLNMTAKVQRQADPQVVGMNSINEPVYGGDSTLPIVYASVDTRIEYNEFDVLYTDLGKRVSPGASTFMIVEPEIILQSKDRVTVLTCADTETIGKTYLVKEVFSEWDAMGNLHHRVAQLDIH